MQNAFVFLITFGFTTTMFSQVVFQEGIARELNSNKKPLSGVFIKFENSGSANTDNSGNFRLAFQDKSAGDIVFLEDIKKSGYEIVNRKDFEIVRITNSKKLATDIILAKAGVVDAAKMKYYGVSDKALLRGLEEEKERLKANLKSAKLKQNDYLEQLEILQKQYENQKKNLDDLAEKFARINFDDVGPIYQEALELFQSGQINEAITLLEGSNPSQRTADIIKEQKRIAGAQDELDHQRAQLEKDKNDQIETIKLLAGMYTANFDLKKAEFQYDQLLLLDSTNLDILIDIANFYREQHLYEKAKRVNLKIISHPNAEINQVANAQCNLGDMHRYTGNLPSAIEAYQGFFNKYSQLYAESPSSPLFKYNLIISYERLGDIYSKLDQLEKALTYFEQSLLLSTELHDMYPQNIVYKSGLTTSYERIGDTYLALDNLEEAMTYFEKILKLSLELYEAHPNDAILKDGLANAYGNMGEIYFSLDNLEKSLFYCEKDMELSIQLYETYPQNLYFKQGLANVYGGIAQIYFSLDNSEKALAYCKKDLKLYLELHEAYPLNVKYKCRLAYAYGNLGEVILEKLEDKSRAMNYFQQSENLLKELVRDVPLNMEYQESLTLLKGVIKGLD
jgi:tetratricopeptide (TPR) repeat protein